MTALKKKKRSEIIVIVRWFDPFIVPHLTHVRGRYVLNFVEILC